MPTTTVRRAVTAALTVATLATLLVAPAVSADESPVQWDLDVTVDQSTAGVPTTFTFSAAPPSGAPSGTVHMYVGGDLVGSMDATVGTTTRTLVPRSGPVEVVVDYVPDEPQFAATRLERTFTFAAATASLDGTVTYTPPSVPDSTGRVDMRVCLVPDDPAVSPDAFKHRLPGFALLIDIELTNHDTGGGFTGGAVVRNLGECHGYAISDEDLTPGDYTFTTVFAGNDHIAPTSARSFQFTVAHAPTELALAVVGDPADTAGMTTRLRASLSGPVLFSPQDGDVTFYVNGDPVGTVTPTGRTAELSVILPAGKVAVTARYSGDAVHAAATSAPLRFDIAQLGATVDLAVTPERVRFGEISTLTASVTIDGPAAASSFLAAARSLGAPRAAALRAGDPAEGTVTFHVNGTPVGTRTLVGGTASMPYVFAAGTNRVSVSYSGTEDVAPVGASVVSPVDVIVEAPPSTPAPAAKGAAPVQGLSPAPTPHAPGTRAAGPSTTHGDSMPHTGAGSRTVVMLGSVLLAAGITVSRIRRRPS